MERKDEPEELPYDFLDRDARRRRLAEESRMEDFRHKSAVFQEQEREKRGLRRRTLLAVLALLFVFALAVRLYAENYRMTTYSVDREESLSGLEEAELVSFGRGTLALFRDSVSYLEEGKILWTELLSFTDPKCVSRGGYAALYEQAGKKLLIFDSDGLLSTITTGQRIRTADITASGVTAVVTEDDEAACISYFDRYGGKISVEIRALLSQTGYPLDIALSPDGQRLAAACFTLEGGLGASQLVLYDFSEGREADGYILAKLDDFRETDTILLDVCFLDDGTLAAVGNDRLRLLKLSASGAETVTERLLTENTEAVFFEGGAAALAEKQGDGTRLELYGSSGSLESTLYAEISYEEIRVGESRVLFREGERIVLMNRNGTLRYDGKLTEAPVTLCFSGKRGILVNTGLVLRTLTIK